MHLAKIHCRFERLSTTAARPSWKKHWNRNSRQNRRSCQFRAGCHRLPEPPGAIPQPRLSKPGLKTHHENDLSSASRRALGIGHCCCPSWNPTVPWGFACRSCDSPFMLCSKRPWRAKLAGSRFLLRTKCIRRKALQGAFIYRISLLEKLSSVTFLIFQSASTRTWVIAANLLGRPVFIEELVGKLPPDLRKFVGRPAVVRPDGKPVAQV